MQIGAAGPGERGRIAERVRQLVSGVRPVDTDPPVPFDDLLGGADGPDAPSTGSGGASWRLAARWLPNRRAAVAMAVVVAVTAVIAGGWYVTSRPEQIAVTSTAAAEHARPASSPPVSAPPTEVAPTAGRPVAPLVVDVAGAVARPGIYQLPPGSRVHHALQAAGGALPGTDTTALNLAAPLVDGEQVIVGGPDGRAGTVLPPVAVAGPSGSGTDGTDGAARVSLNGASAQQLESLPGVGPVLAQKILDWRSEHGRFRSVDELRQVSGIGEVKFAALKSRVTL